MQLNVGKEVAALEEMPVSQLRDRYAEVFGETTNARNSSKRPWNPRDEPSLRLLAAPWFFVSLPKLTI